MKSSVLVGVWGVLLSVGTAYAMPAYDNYGQGQVPCGILTRLEGDVQILDPSRTNFIHTVEGSAIPCGGWVNVRQGVAEIEHRQGYRFHLAQNTFVEVYDNINNKELSGKDHLVIYKGQALVEIPPKSTEIRILTANSVITSKQGSLLAIYSPESDETQSVALKGKLRIANRFDTSKSIAVAEGESSSVNFRTLRVLPTEPSALSVASVRGILNEMLVGSEDEDRYLGAVKSRLDRTFASDISRKIASNKKKSDYNRHPASGSDDRAHQAWVKRLVGGADQGEKILYPDSNGTAVDTSGVSAVTGSPEEEEREKKRLLEELSHSNP